MKWDDLRVLLAVRRTGSLARAARMLRVDETTVGRRLTALERELGARLLDRKPSGQSLTEAGRKACAAAEVMEGSAQSLHELRGLDEGLSGRIRVTTLGALVPIVAAVMARMRASSPRLTFEMSYEQKTADLVAGEADVAIRLGNMRAAKQPSLVGRKLLDLDWSVWGSEGYVRDRGPLTPGLHGHDVIGYEEPLSRIPGAVWLAENAREAEVVVSVNNALSAAECSAAGLGLTASPANIARSLGLVRVGPVFATNGVWAMATAPVARVTRVRAFIEHLAKVFGTRQGEFRAPPLT